MRIQIRKLTSRVSTWMVVVAFVAVIGGGAVFAASNSDFTQIINAGVLSTDIVDNSGNTVANPSVPMTTQNFSFNCQTSTSVNPFGTNTQRIYASNPDAADNGWTLTVAAASPTTLWQNTGNTQNYDFNDVNGCTDGADGDSRGGQLTINPATGTITPDCSGCNNTGITTGTSAGFVEGTTNSITLINAASNSQDIWRGYLTGVGVSQAIPAQQAADSYTLNLVVTIQ
ncbi:hypothetical protein E6Q11_05030 [Candidatus Dojkabacteria bacterium]|uniref:WxL domain-containing protein n=1 Tax=Candidatus Dojkabacteria bacterium TaxID=2099670 RepID=A0A5C7J6U1_9BACT|nr:MAG: hypothetical protein E6Q11_05030 [Candidatus Dojkabacteria bacterium]